MLGAARAIKFEVAWSLRRPMIPIDLPGFPNPFLIRRFSSDLMVFSQVFVARELEVFLPASPRLIVDGGANVGFSTAFYAEQFPQAKVVAVEPSVSNCEMINRNCRGFDNVTVVLGALWPRRTYLRIANPDAQAWSYRVEECGQNGTGSTLAWTVGDLLEASGCSKIDLLKLDIEGAEQYLFSEGYEQWLRQVDAMVIEIHSLEAEEAIESAIDGAGFTRVAKGERTVIFR